MHGNEIIYALICNKNHVLLCQCSMLSIGRPSQRLRKYIGELVCGSDMRCTDGILHNILANEMIVDLNMFCPHVKGIVAGDEIGCARYHSTSS